jgi:hypothetical protein
VKERRWRRVRDITLGSKAVGVNFKLVAEPGAGDISFIPARGVFAVLISEKPENSR